MNLVIDIGNSSTKAAFFKDHQLISRHHNISRGNLDQLIKRNKPANVIISATGQNWVSDLLPSFIRQINLDDKTLLPFKVAYNTPKTLGPDRLAGVAGGMFLYPGQNILVVDMGTCITYDYLSKDKIYYGGGISPGIQMRFNAMNTYTDRLPKLEIPEYAPDLVGDSTQASMESGVINGASYEIRGLISAYNEKFGLIKPILTGGNTVIFEKKLKGLIFAAPDLVLLGLNVILQYNVAKS